MEARWSIPHFWGLDSIRQVRTSTDLEVAAARIEKLRRDEVLDEAAVRRIVEETSDGLDAWGNGIQVVWRAQDRSYLLVATGADGRLDVPFVESYFDATSEIVSGQVDSEPGVQEWYGSEKGWQVK